MSNLETYRTGSVLKEVLSLVEECQKLSNKKKEEEIINHKIRLQKKKDKEEKIALKAIKDSETYLSSVIKKIKRAASKGKEELTYEGNLFNLFLSWNDSVAKILFIKLKDLGFEVAFKESGKYHEFGNMPKYYKSRLEIKWHKRY